MIDQGITITNIVLHQDKLCKKVCLTTEEVIGLKGDYPWDGRHLLLLDERSCFSFVLHKGADDGF